MAVIDRRDPDAVSDDTRSPGSPNYRKALIAGSLFMAAWLVPWAANTAHLDWILPIILLLGTASLLRVGHTILDRLIIAGFVLAGLLITEGVLFSRWPWGIEPIPVTGLTGSLLAAIGTERHVRLGWQPSLPRRVRGTDLIVLAAPVAAWLTVRRPLAGKGFVDLLPYSITTQDRINHFSLFDLIHRIGAYQYLQENRSQAIWHRMGFYPPGVHYLYALLDTYRRSTTDAGDSIHEYLRYVHYEVLGFSILALAVTWAARWIAGPMAIGPWRVLLCAAVGAFTAAGSLAGVFWEAFDAETMALAILAVVVALSARPPRDAKEQAVVTGALLILLTYTYTPFLPVAVVPVAAALVVYRRRLRPSARFVSTIAVATGVIIALPVWEALRIQDPTNVFSAAGDALSQSVPITMAFLAFTLAAIATAKGRRLPVWRVTTASAAGAILLATFADVVGVVSTGEPQYYSTKYLAAAFVIALCGTGGILTWLNQRRLTTEPARSPKRLLAPLALIVIAVGAPHGYPTGFVKDAGQWRPRPRALANYGAVGRFGDGVPTILVVSSNRQVNRDVSAFLAGLNHRLCLLDVDALDADRLPPTEPPDIVAGVDRALVLLNSSISSATTEQEDQALTRVEHWLRNQPAGERIGVTSARFASLLRDFATREPDLRLSVLLVPITQGDQSPTPRP